MSFFSSLRFAVMTQWNWWHPSPSIFPSIRVFSNESALRIRWPKYWSFSFSISSFNAHPGLISFRVDWLDLLAVQGRSNQSTLKQISPKYSLEELMLKLKLQYFGHLTRKTDSFEKSPIRCWERLRAGGEGDDRGWDGWMASPTQWTWVWVDSGSWWWTGRPGMLWFMGSQRVGHDWPTKLNWMMHLL